MKEFIKKYGQAVDYLPPRLRSSAMSLPEDEKLCANEFRLRAGRHFSVCGAGREIDFTKESTVRHEELRTVIELATKSSVHSMQSSLREGYVTVPGGHRIGICGTAIRDEKEIRGFRELSSVSIRIASSVETAAEGICEKVVKDSRFRNTLIISPPGHGKTTTLRDMVRRLSDGGFRVSLVDERGEIAAKYRGVPQFDVGKRTDVIDGINKADGAMMMLRTMSPDIIALDEITAREDIRAVCESVSCGVGILATAHGYDADSLFSRPLYEELLKLKVFEFAVVLRREGNRFYKHVTEMDKL